MVDYRAGQHAADSSGGVRLFEAQAAIGLLLIGDDVIASRIICLNEHSVRVGSRAAVLMAAGRVHGSGEGSDACGRCGCCASQARDRFMNSFPFRDRGADTDQCPRTVRCYADRQREGSLSSSRKDWRSDRVPLQIPEQCS